MDDSPLKSFLNLNVNLLFPSPFVHYLKGNSFSIEALLPFLQKLYKAFDVRHYLSVNYPKWSTLNLGQARERDAAIFSAFLGLGASSS